VTNVANNLDDGISLAIPDSSRFGRTLRVRIYEGLCLVFLTLVVPLMAASSVVPTF
jgi:hypothetical protein